MWALLAAAFASTVVPHDGGWLTLLLAEMQVVFFLVHLATWTSWRTSAAVFATIYVIAFTAEAIGTNTGVVFGPYRYSDTALGPLVLGVPPLLVLAYTSIGYAAYVIARLIVAGTYAFTARITGLRLGLVAGLTGLLMAAQDLTFDPINSTLLGQWVWTGGGAYFGVPPHNFYGWAATGAVFTLAVGYLLARRRVWERTVRPWPRWFMVQPVALWGVFAFPTIVAPLTGATGTIHEAMSVVAVITLTIPVVAAACALGRSAPAGPAADS